MKAYVLHQPQPVDRRPLQLEDRPVPEPGPRELLVRVQVGGICHTDLHTVEDDIHPPSLPIVPGRQVIGAVAELGVGVLEVARQ